MRFELKTLIFDIICALVFIGLGLIYFNAIIVILPVKIIAFGLAVVLIGYFGIFRNHNYTKAAFENHGQFLIKKGKVISNLDVTEQAWAGEQEGVED